MSDMNRQREDELIFFTWVEERHGKTISARCKEMMESNPDAELMTVLDGLLFDAHETSKSVDFQLITYND